jgi:RND family efflux transporter MFP subunit
MNKKKLQSLVLDETHYTSDRRVGLKFFLVTALTVLLVLLAAYWLWERYRPRPVVTVEQVLTKTGEIVVEGTAFEAAGWIEPDPFPRIVSSRIPGWIIDIHALEGDKVKKGDLLIEIYDEDYQLTLERLKSKRASLLADLEYQEVQQGIETRLVAASALDTLALARTEARVNASEAGLREIDLEIELARRNLERCRVFAPFDGVVMRRHVVRGQFVGDGRDSDLLTLYDPERVQARVDVNLVDVPKLQIGKDCEVRLESAPGTVFPAKIYAILHEADNQKNTVQVKVRLIETSNLVKPEMLARVKFLSERRMVDRGDDTYITYVPVNALREEGGTRYVFVLRRKNGRTIAEKKVVTVGAARSGEWIEIREGLDPSSKIITASTSPLKDGEIVNTK